MIISKISILTQSNKIADIDFDKSFKIIRIFFLRVFDYFERGLNFIRGGTKI